MITLDWPPLRGGVANYLYNIYSRLPRDFSVILAQPLFSSPYKGGARGGWVEQTPPHLPFERGGDLTIYRRELLGKIWPKWLRAYFEAVKIIRAEKIEAIHISHILPMGYVAWMIKKVCGLSYVVYLHGMDIMLAQKSPWKRWWAKKILRGADLVVANSKFTANEAIKAGAQEDKIEILYPCPHIRIPTDFERISTDAPNNIILSVGRLVQRKGFDKVIEAMPEILREVPNAEYHIVGDGPYAVGLKQLAEKSGVGGRVKFFHNISDADLPEFYRNCKIFVMPSRQIGGDVEGFGIVYLEAALFGKPSVVGNVGGAPEAVLNNQTGLTVNPESPSEIAASIVKLLKDDNLRQTFGRAAKGRAEKEFNWNNQLSKIINKL